MKKTPKRFSHKERHLPEYRSWSEAKSRVVNKSHHAYLRYGGRGITMYRPWRIAYPKFLAYLLKTIGRKPSSKHSLDRIDNSKGYFPGSIRWATAKEQARNRRTNHHLMFNGETRTLSEWAEFIGMNIKTLDSRVRYGWSVRDILTKPIRSWGR